MSNDLPIGQAIIFCSEIESDSNGDIQSLIGIFGVMEFESFPITEELNVYVCVTGMIGENKIQLRMADEGVSNFHVVNTLICNHESQNEVRQIHLANKIRFRRPGIYVFEVQVNDARVLKKLLTVRQKKKTVPTLTIDR
jgi:uncharacterized protein DUF6941